MSSNNKENGLNLTINNKDILDKSNTNEYENYIITCNKEMLISLNNLRKELNDINKEKDILEEDSDRYDIHKNHMKGLLHNLVEIENKKDNIIKIHNDILTTNNTLDNIIIERINNFNKLIIVILILLVLNTLYTFIFDFNYIIFGISYILIALIIKLSYKDIKNIYGLNILFIKNRNNTLHETKKIKNIISEIDKIKENNFGIHEYIDSTCEQAVRGGTL